MVIRFCWLSLCSLVDISFSVTINVSLLTTLQYSSLGNYGTMILMDVCKAHNGVCKAQ